MDTTPIAPTPDEWKERLQTSLRRERPRVWRWTLMIFLPPALLIAFMVWWFFPGPAPPRLLVVALDVLKTADETPALRCRLEPHDPALREAPPRDIEVLFFAILPSPRQEKKATVDPRGEAVAEWDLEEKEATAAFLVRHVGDKSSPGGDDRARLFRWPAAAKLLVVDVEETLLAVEPQAWPQANPQDVQAVAGAAAALQAAHKKSHHIVYLADQPARAVGYRRTRAWLENRMGQGEIPQGPALGRRVYGDAAAPAAVRLDLLKDLRRRFQGPILAVVARPEAADLARQAGVTPIFHGEAPDGKESLHIKSWFDLEKVLGK